MTDRTASSIQQPRGTKEEGLLMVPGQVCQEGEGKDWATGPESGSGEGRRGRDTLSINFAGSEESHR